MQRTGLGQRTVNSNPPALRQSLKQDWKKASIRPQKENALNDDAISQIECFNAKSNLMTSKNPSFSLTSDYSRQYNNQSISEIKAYQKNIFSNTTNSQISCLQSSKVARKLNDEIEELFERANNHFHKATVKQGNIISAYKTNQLMEYKLSLKASQESLKPIHKPSGSLTRQAPSNIIEQKICSEDEGMPFSTLLSYQQEEVKTDKTEEANSFGDSSSPSPSISESVKRQKKIEAKFRRVSNPFRSQFDAKKKHAPANIQSLLTQDFEGSTFNHHNNNRQTLSKNFTSQRKSVTPDMVYFGNHFCSSDGQTETVPNQKHLQSQHSTAQRSQVMTQTKSTNHEALSQSTSTILQTVKSTLKSKLVPKALINLDENPQLRPQKIKYVSAKPYQTMSTGIRIAQPAPKVAEITLLKQKHLVDETDNDESIDSIELSNKKLCRNQSSKIFKTVVFDKKQIEQVSSPNFTRESQGFSPRVKQTLSKVFSFNESKMQPDSRNSNYIKLATDAPLVIRQSKEKLESIRSLLEQNNALANSTTKRAKWDISASKNKQSSTTKNSERGNDKSQSKIENLQKLSKDESEQLKKEQEKERVEELQRQYLLIKKQLLEIKGKAKKNDSRVKEEDMREIVGVLSSDNEDSEGIDDDRSVNSSKYNQNSNINQPVTSDHSQTNASSLRNKSVMRNQPLYPQNSKQSRQKAQNHFKSVDIKHQNYRAKPEIFTSSSQINVMKTTKKENAQQRKVEHQVSLKPKSMKSHANIGVRKLSYKEKEMEVRQARRQETEQTYKRKSSMKKGGRRSNNSQVSFVGICCDDGCLSQHSSCKYKDCFSGTKYFTKPKRSESSTSSKYYLANDGETICSCCQEEFEHSKYNSCYQSRKNIHYQERKSGHGTKRVKHNDPDRSHKKSDHKTKEKKKRKSTSLQKERLESHEKLRHMSREGGSMDRIKVSNRLSETVGLWQVPQQFTQQMPFNRIRQSLDQIHQLWPNLNPNFQMQLAHQLQQTQAFQPGFQQQNFQIYLPNQHMLLPNILNQPLIQPTLIASPMTIENSLGFKNVKDMNKIIEGKVHKEQIEVIESLIKIAKKKLDTNHNQSTQEPCKRSKPNQDQYQKENYEKKHQTRNDKQLYHTYDQNRMNSIGDLNIRSAKKEPHDIDHTMRNNMKFQEQYNDMLIAQRRNSDQIVLSSKPQRNELDRSEEQPLRRVERSGSKVIAKQLEKLSSHFTTNDQSKDSSRWESKADQHLQERLSTFDKRQSKDNRLKRIQEEEFSNERDCWQKTEKQHPKERHDNIPKARVAQRIDLEDYDTFPKQQRENKVDKKQSALQSKAHLLDSLETSTAMRVDLTNCTSSNGEVKVKKVKQNWMMEFAVNDGTKDIEGVNNLAEAFKKKMGNSNIIEKKERVSLLREKREFSKQELLERKKELLKQARSNLHSKQQAEEPTTEAANSISQDKEVITNPKVVCIDISSSGKSKPSTKNDNPAQILNRLSAGQKTEISKQDMKKLTSKNYEQLPEIKKRKHEESKKQDLMKRIATVKELEKKRRESVVRKRNAANALVSQQSVRSAKTKEGE